MQKACFQSCEKRFRAGVLRPFHVVSIGWHRASANPVCSGRFQSGDCAWNALLATVRRTTATNEQFPAFGIPSLLKPILARLISFAPQITIARGVRILFENVSALRATSSDPPLPAGSDEVVRVSSLASVLARRGRARFGAASVVLLGRGRWRGRGWKVGFGLRAQRVLYVIG